jgi:hypothetical protein
VNVEGGVLKRVDGEPKSDANNSRVLLADDLSKFYNHIVRHCASCVSECLLLLGLLKRKMGQVMLAQPFR